MMLLTMVEISILGVKLPFTIGARVFKHSTKVRVFHVSSHITLPCTNLTTDSALNIALIFSFSYFRDVFVEVKEARNSQTDIIRAFTLPHVLGRIQPIIR